MAMDIINHLKDQLVYDDCLWPTNTILLGNRATSLIMIIECQIIISVQNLHDNPPWQHHLMITEMIIDCQSIITDDSSAYKTCTTIPLGSPATVPPVFGTSRTLVTWFSNDWFQIGCNCCEIWVFAALLRNIKMKANLGCWSLSWLSC